MAERLTAERRLATLLELIPRAARHPEGVPISELARELGIDEKRLLRDLQEVSTRSFYLPPGALEDIQIYIEDDRVALWTPGNFRRPVRLGPRESLALALGLRVLGAGADADRRRELLDLAARLEGRLLSGEAGGSAGFEIHPGLLPSGGFHDLLVGAARDHRRCRISYLKPAAMQPDDRDIDPYVLLVADGRWYVVGHCHRGGAVRVFRLDRIIAAEVLDAGFQTPEHFDPGEYVTDGRVFRAAQFKQVTVRYSGRIARWIAEREPAQLLEDGSAICRYSVADPAWIVRHVLEHGPDAEVLGPEEVRSRLAQALDALVARL
jgi:proteasome accessory factor C